jgi:hypothetical protein
MGKIADMIANLKSLTVEKQVADIAKIVQGHESTIVDMNRSQLLLGEDSEGKSLGEYHNEEYKEFKRILNPREVVDLRLTGSFHREMFLKGASFPFTVDSADSKRNILIEGDGYGPDVFGVNEPNKETLRQDVLKEEIQGYYRENILNLR